MSFLCCLFVCLEGFFSAIVVVGFCHGFFVVACLFDLLVCGFVCL